MLFPSNASRIADDDRSTVETEKINKNSFVEFTVFQGENVCSPQGVAQK
jgi:hypothetical protein